MNDPRIANYVALLKDRDYYVRSDAAQALEKFGNAALPSLIELLKDKSNRVRGLAALVLGKLGDASAVPALVEVMNDENNYGRRDAVFALGKMGHASVVPALTDLLRDKHDLMRTTAACALGDIGDASAVPALIVRLKDKNNSVREAAAQALGKIGDSGTLPRKILATQWFSTEERIEVLDKLRSLRYSDRRTTLRYRFPDTRALCREVLQEEDPAARAGALAALRWLDGDRHLLRPAERDPSTEAQTLVRAVQGGKDRIPPDTLVRPADEPDTECRS